MASPYRAPQIAFDTTIILTCITIEIHFKAIIRLDKLKKYPFQSLSQFGRDCSKMRQRVGFRTQKKGPRLKWCQFSDIRGQTPF